MSSYVLEASNDAFIRRLLKRIRAKVAQKQNCGKMGRQQYKRRSAVHGQEKQKLGSESTVHLQSRVYGLSSLR
jgi:hypothetical protein